MIEVSFQGETHHCFPNNPQSDTGSDTQDTNTMTSVAADWRQQNGGSKGQWENVPVCTCQYTNTPGSHGKDLQASTEILVL